MSDLRALAEASQTMGDRSQDRSDCRCAWRAFDAAVSPEVVLALLAAIPDDPRCAGWCYACAAEAPAHRGGCAWVAARSAMVLGAPGFLATGRED